MIYNIMEINNKYQNGKIYQITDVGYNKCYIGSTIEKLSNRMAKHRLHFKAYKNGKFNNISSFQLFEEFGVENCKIELVESFPCNNKGELEAREGYHIRNTECINKCIVGRSLKEWRSDNAEMIKVKKKEWVSNNVEHVKAKAKEYRDNNQENIKVYRKEWNTSHKEEKKTYNRCYNQIHKEEINDKRSVITKCECGGRYQLRNKARHLKSDMHQAYLETPKT